MSQQSKKTWERTFVEDAAKLLDKPWILGPDREHPDFIVKEDAQRFGIEVSEVFVGPKDEKGSRLKEAESKNQKVINTLRQDVESVIKIPLIVKFLGNLCPENMERIKHKLLAMDLPSKPLKYQDDFVVNPGPRSCHVYVTRAYRPYWFSVNDKTGWVEFDPERVKECLDKEIKKKAEKLPSYKESSGLNDIRLLLVANRCNNSGKISLDERPTDERPTLDLRGFQVVYFFSYPYSVTPISHKA